MKTIQKKSACLVSDRAYRHILTDCINVMTQKGVAPDIFMAVIMAVKEYLETGQLAHRPINRVRNILDLFRTDIERAIRRAASARKAAESRRKERLPESEQPTADDNKSKPAHRIYSFPSLGVLKPGKTPSAPRPSRGTRCPGIERFRPNTF
ncbi:MAG: hypothetical protein K2L30_10150 [Duncaniella sp.]|nr:hypothetical protein [Duncaniella sp.]